MYQILVSDFGVIRPNRVGMMSGIWQLWQLIGAALGKSLCVGVCVLCEYTCSTAYSAEFAVWWLRRVWSGAERVSCVFCGMLWWGVV